jgi:hypothetical protein
MKRVLNKLPTISGHYGFDSFNTGFARLGYVGVPKLPNPDPHDILVIWNRYGESGALANRFEAIGARVIVVENSYMGKHWRGAQWYALALGHHAGAGEWPSLGGDRWRSWGVELAPWRTPGGETVVLGQRSIGEAGIKSPTDWHKSVAKQVRGARVRLHPGKDPKTKTLETDLARASVAVTWASAAGIKALMLGVPVFYAYPKWIGATACRPLAQMALGPLTDDELRLRMFERLAHAMCTRDEITSGEALDKLLSYTREKKEPTHM